MFVLWTVSWLILARFIPPLSPIVDARARRRRPVRPHGRAEARTVDHDVRLGAAGAVLRGDLRAHSANLSPNLTAQQTANQYSDHADAIRVGMVLMTLGAVRYLPWTVLLAQIIRQIERGTRMLPWTQLLAGVLSALPFVIPAYIWAAISFRPHRDPAITQTLSDLGWLVFITQIGPFIIQYATVAIAIFVDDREVDPAHHLLRLVRRADRHGPPACDPGDADSTS
jgi:hypothetical protein